MRGAALELTVNVRVDSGSRPPELLETSGSRVIRFSRGSYHTDHNNEESEALYY
jgi:hypothetical protein